MKLSEVEKAYIAGIIDGEGHIGIVPSNSVYFNCRVGITNTNERMIKWLEARVGVDASKYESKGTRWKDRYNIDVGGVVAKELLQLVYPYLVAKKEQARIILEDFPYQSSKSGHRHYTEEEKLQQALCAIRLAKLNKKGNPNANV